MQSSTEDSTGTRTHVHTVGREPDYIDRLAVPREVSHELQLYLSILSQEPPYLLGEQGGGEGRGGGGQVTRQWCGKRYDSL